MGAAPSRLLAKSLSDPLEVRSEELLAGHTAMVVASAEELLQHRGEESLAAVGLAAGLLGRLKRVVQLAAFAHDLGKCSDHFQAMLRKEREAPQLVRHEALSLWLCWPGQPLAEWLRPAVDSDDDYVTALLAAVAHHRKFATHALAAEDSGSGSDIRLLVDHDDFVRTLVVGTRTLGLGRDAPVFSEPLVVDVRVRGGLPRLLRTWEMDSEDITRSNRAFLGIAKALVLAADVAGSALPRARQKPRWIGAQLTARATAEELASVAYARLAGKSPRPFQSEVSSSNAPITLVRAGCGSGKTVAAYLWAATNHAGRQLWVTYPTTGTATEGFRDYIADAAVTGRLEHGRADVDLDIFGLRDGDEDSPRDFDRLEAIRSWGTDVITCTVDTVLGLLQNQRKGLYAWPGLAHSAVVFDEIHAYDSRLFGNLLTFLRTMRGVPVLLMTASLPRQRLAMIEEICRDVHGRDLSIIEGPADLEQMPRYQRSLADDPERVVGECLAQGGKVLWISNTVDRCMKVADMRFASVEPIVYHSRFRYCDRVKQHGRVIDAFNVRINAGAALATTTQVAEMSLDLSADLLVTDLAPIPALIQRLGRLNRRSSPVDPQPPKSFVVLPFAGLPYENDELVKAEEWLSRLGSKPLSQADLVNAWVDQDGVDAPAPSAWCEGGFNTEPAAVRDATVGITVILSKDARGVRDGSEKVQRVALPMNQPRGSDWRSWKRVGFLPVCPPEAVDYDSERGARWRSA